MRLWTRITLGASALFLALSPQTAPRAEAQALEPDKIIEEGVVMHGSPLEAVLQLLSELTARAILRPQALPTPEITFDSGGAITHGELVLALESLLSLNNIGISPLGDRFLKVVPLNVIRTEAPELVTSSLADREPSGQVVSKLFRLQYLDSQTFQQQIQPFLSPGFSAIIPFQNSNAVIVTDTVSNLQRLEYVVSEVDKPLKLNIETKFFALQFAQASEVAQQIQSLLENARSRFGAQNNPQGPSRGNREPAADMPQPQPDPAAGADGSIPLKILFGSNTAISSDDRTNQLIIMTEPSNLGFFVDIIERLDVKADPSTRIEVIPLKHADATEVASLLSQFVSGKTQSQSGDRATTTSSRERRPSRQPNATFGDNTIPPVVAPETQTRALSAIEAATEDRDSQFSSFMTIVADERSNALMISGTRSDLELIVDIVERIDVLLAQVQIEVVIVDVNLTNEMSRGSDVIQGILDDTGPTTKYTLGTVAAGGAGFNILGLNLAGTTFNYENGEVSNLVLNAIFQRARSNSNINVLSVPTIVTTHNKEASILVGQAVPIVTSSQSDLVNTSASRQSFQFQDIAIELTVKPLIGPNDIIQMQISQKIDEIADTVRIDDTDQPIIGRREASSFVSVRNRELVILGGLQRDRNSKSESRPSLIGEIPLIGRLFSSRGKNYQKSELMVFIRPTVMRTTDQTDAHADKKIGNLQSSESVERFLEEGDILLEAESADRVLSDGEKAVESEEASGEKPSAKRKKVK